MFDRCQGRIAPKSHFYLPVCTGPLKIFVALFSILMNISVASPGGTQILVGDNVLHQHRGQEALSGAGQAVMALSPDGTAVGRIGQEQAWGRDNSGADRETRTRVRQEGLNQEWAWDGLRVGPGVRRTNDQGQEWSRARFRDKTSSVRFRDSSEAESGSETGVKPGQGQGQEWGGLTRAPTGVWAYFAPTGGADTPPPRDLRNYASQ